MVNGGGRPINDADTETIWITCPLRLVPQDMTRVLLNLFSNGFYAATRRARSEVGAYTEFTVTIPYSAAAAPA
jgi:hypothetical protein